MSGATVQLGELATVIAGYAFKSRDFVQRGVPVVKIANVTWAGVDLSHSLFLPEEFLSINERFHVNHGDILISLTGSQLSQPNSVVGRVARYNNDSTALLNQRVGKLVPNDPRKCDIRFVYYLLKQDTVTYQLAINAKGSANQANISGKDIERLRVPALPLEQQARIASILSAYDDLIENNQRRIRLLEQAARLLYWEWFVRLRFPGHEHVKIIDGVPEGWEKSTVSGLGKIVTGKTPSTKTPENFGGNIPFVKTPDMHRSLVIVETEEFLSERGANTQANKTLPVGSILVACIGARLGVVSITCKPCQTNQQINTVIPSHDHYRYYGLFALIDIKPRLEAMGGGATMPNVNKSKFASIPILIPSQILLQEFQEFASYTFQQIQLLHQQNVALTQARNLLLPRLMNGEIKV